MASTSYVVQRQRRVGDPWSDTHETDSLDEARATRDGLTESLGEFFRYRIVERTETVIDDKEPLYRDPTYGWRTDERA